MSLRSYDFMPRPDITFVTPTLNAGMFLRRCLQSVHQEQRSIHVEHLILDGGSTDETLSISNEFPVRFIERPKDMGLVNAICLGFELAEGNLVSFIGADDLVEPQSLQKVVAEFDRFPSDAIFARTRWVDPQLRSLGELAPLPRWCSAKTHASLGWCYQADCSTFVTKKVYDSFGGFDRSYSMCIDYEFTTRLLEKRVSIGRVNDVVGMYCRHSENQSTLRVQDLRSDLRLLWDRYNVNAKAERLFRSGLLKSWVYLRNPKWAFHQLSKKIRARKFFES